MISVSRCEFYIMVFAKAIHHAGLLTRALLTSSAGGGTPDLFHMGQTLDSIRFFALRVIALAQ